MLLFSVLQRNSSESAQCLERRAARFGEVDIQLDDLIPIALAGVLYVDFHIEGIARLQLRTGELESAVFKRRITQTWCEPVQRFGGEVAVGAVLHVVIFEVGQLFGSLVKGHRESS